MAAPQQQMPSYTAAPQMMMEAQPTMMGAPQQMPSYTAAPQMMMAAPTMTMGAPVTMAAPQPMTVAAPQMMMGASQPVPSAFDMMDRNHDGVISRQEFNQAFQPTM